MVIDYFLERGIKFKYCDDLSPYLLSNFSDDSKIITPSVSKSGFAEQTDITENNDDITDKDVGFNHYLYGKISSTTYEYDAILDFSEEKIEYLSYEDVIQLNMADFVIDQSEEGVSIFSMKFLVLFLLLILMQLNMYLTRIMKIFFHFNI